MTALPEAPACIRCDYNLAGVATDGRCPECGLPVTVSRRGALMLAAPDAYLDALQRGFLAAAVGMIIVGVGQLLWGGPDPVGMRIMIARPGTKAIRITITVGMIVWLYGLWRITQPNPVDRAADLYRRLAVRICIAVAAAGAAASLYEAIIAGTAGANIIGSPPWMRWLHPATAYGMPAAFVAAAWFSLTVLRRLAPGRIGRLAFTGVTGLAALLLLAGAITTASGFLVYWNRYGARTYIENRDLLIWPWTALLTGLFLYASTLAWLWWRLRRFRRKHAQ